MNRDITVADIKARLDELAGKVTKEGQELFEDLQAKTTELLARMDSTYDEAWEDLQERYEEIQEDLASLYGKVSKEGEEILKDLEERYENLVDILEEEVAELHDLGVVDWVKANPTYAAWIGGGIFVVLILLAIAL